MTVKPPTQPVWYTLVVVLVVAVLLSAVSVVVSVQLNKRSDRQNEQKWCELISTLDEGYSSNPSQPTTPRGQKLREDIHRLRLDLGC